MFNINNVISEINIFNVDLPKDLISYNITDPESSTFTDNFYLNENIYVNSSGINTGATWCSTGYTSVYLNEDMFKTGDTVYVQNLFLLDPSGNTIDYSGAYEILDKSGTTEIIIDLQVYGYSLVGKPKVSYYRGLEISILRINGSDSSIFDQRYDVTYKII
jgi:hypothetical protein